MLRNSFRETILYYNYKKRSYEKLSIHTCNIIRIVRYIIIKVSEILILPKKKKSEGKRETKGTKRQSLGPLKIFGIYF